MTYFRSVVTQQLRSSISDTRCFSSFTFATCPYEFPHIMVSEEDGLLDIEMEGSSAANFCRELKIVGLKVVVW
jgi:hypothetical protein